MSDPSGVPPPAGGEGGDAGLAETAAAWEAMVKSGMAFPVLPGVAGQPGFVYPGFMLPGLMPGFGLPAEGEGKEGEEGQGSDEDDTQDEGARDDGSSDDSGRPKRRRAARKKKDGPVKSNSSAALAMLAGAAANKPGMPGALNPAVAGAMQSIEGMWGTLNGGAAGMQAAASGLDLSKLTPEQQQQLMSGDYADLAGITDERELKRMRRKQSNRESARRSRLRKQAECEQLARQVKELANENARLKEEKMSLVAQIEILNAKLSMSAFGVHALGGGAAVGAPADLEKMQAEMRAKQDMSAMHGMAAAMAQAMQVNGGMMAGIPTIDPSLLEGKTPEEAAAIAAAAAAAAVGELGGQQDGGA